MIDELWKQQSVPALERFAKRLDVTRLGVFGMSFGGATATDVCLRDARCRAGVNMDGLQFGAATALDTALQAPFMFMMSEPFGVMPVEPVFRRAQGPAWLLTINGSTHIAYTDMALYSPLFGWIGLTGKIDGNRMQRLMNEYLLAFFDRNLRGQHSALLNGPLAGYPEIVLETRNTGGAAGE